MEKMVTYLEVLYSNKLEVKALLKERGNAIVTFLNTWI